jgi:hypothetical protein
MEDVEASGIGAVVSFASLVATPTPRHSGHALRPDPNHYKLVR